MDIQDYERVLATYKTYGGFHETGINLGEEEWFI